MALVLLLFVVAISDTSNCVEIMGVLGMLLLVLLLPARGGHLSSSSNGERVQESSYLAAQIGGNPDALDYVVQQGCPGRVLTVYCTDPQKDEPNKRYHVSHYYELYL